MKTMYLLMIWKVAQFEAQKGAQEKDQVKGLTEAQGGKDEVAKEEDQVKGSTETDIEKGD